MNIANIRITSFDTDGKTIPVDTSTKWGNKLLLALKDNIKENEEVLFSILTTRADKISISELHHIYRDTVRLDCFYCLTLLADKLIVISMRYVKLLSLTDYDVGTNIITLSTIDSVSWNQIDTKFGMQYGCKIITSIPEVMSEFGYKVPYHLYIKPFIDEIENSIRQKQNNHNKNFEFLLELERLAKLKNEGFLSDDEFLLAKKRLLS